MAAEDDPIRGLVKGKEIVMRECSLYWWKVKPGTDGEDVRDWRIVEEADYAVNAQQRGGGH
jgi:hypothetical protein